MMKARVVVPPSFTAANLDLLKQRLETYAGESVAMQVNRDPSLIGGFVVYMHSWVYDASIKSRLERVRAALSAASAQGNAPEAAGE